MDINFGILDESLTWTVWHFAFLYLPGCIFLITHETWSRSDFSRKLFIKVLEPVLSHAALFIQVCIKLSHRCGLFTANKEITLHYKAYKLFFKDKSSSSSTAFRRPQLERGLLHSMQWGFTIINKSSRHTTTTILKIVRNVQYKAQISNSNIIPFRLTHHGSRY